VEEVEVGMKLFNTFLSGMLLSFSLAAGQAWAAIPAHPGMLNYVEGQARINGSIVTASNIGTADVGEGQVIETGRGKAEILLTPGVFLRLGDNSSVRMDSAGLIDTRVAILSGRVMIEADNLQNGNNIRILDNGAVSRLEKNGIYSFTANPAEADTIDGKMQVTENDQHVDLGKGHQTMLQATLHSSKFDRNADENDPLYQWSKVRSQYLAAANVDQAQAFMMNGAGWYGPGWYWDPWFDMYSWIPGGGPFWSPFGWGFYSPFSVWQAPIFYHGYYGYHGYPGGRVIAGRAPARVYGGGVGHVGGMGRIGGSMGHMGGGGRR
jgi:hypothetical protein